MTKAKMIQEMIEELKLWGRDWVIKSNPKKRRMTRREILGKLAQSGTILVSPSGCEYLPEEKQVGDISNWYKNYRYATITEDGEIGELHEFEVEE